MPYCDVQDCYIFVDNWGDYCRKHRPAPEKRAPDPVNEPNHYKAGGIEAIQVIDAFELGFNLGNVVKYVLRAGRKDPTKTLEDLRKAESYLKREIAKREKLEST